MKLTSFLSAMLLIIVSSSVLAQSSNSESVKAKKATAYLSKKEHQKLVEIQAVIDSDQLEQAVSKIEQMHASKVSPLASALGQQLLGIIYQTQLDYPKALAAYEKAISYKQLPRASKVKLFEKIHKLSYFLKDWQQVVHWWLKWEKRAKPQAQDYLLLSSAYRHQKKWKQAKEALLKALSIEKKPPQLWSQLLLEYEERLENKSQQEKLLKKLLVRYPQTESYWLKLAKIYTASNRDKQASALLLSAFNAEVLGDIKSVKWLINFLASQKNYMRAVAVLDTAVTQKILQRAAVEHQAIDYLMRAKAYQQVLARVQKNIAVDPSFPKNEPLASANFALQRWHSAYQAALNIPKEKTKNSIKWQLLLAISSANLAEKQRAKKHFSTVLVLDKSNPVAISWMSQL